MGYRIPDEVLRPFAEEVASCQGLHSEQAISETLGLLRSVITPEYTRPRYWTDMRGNIRRTPCLKPIIRKGLRA